jgi:2-iminoacetate synthase ThiH
VLGIAACRFTLRAEEELFRLKNKSVDAIPIYAAEGEDAATSMGSVN